MGIGDWCRSSRWALVAAVVAAVATALPRLCRSAMQMAVECYSRRGVAMGRSRCELLLLIWAAFAPSSRGQETDPPPPDCAEEWYMAGDLCRPVLARFFEQVEIDDERAAGFREVDGSVRLVSIAMGGHSHRARQSAFISKAQGMRCQLATRTLTDWNAHG